MIIQSYRKPDILLPDMTFWTMTIMYCHRKFGPPSKPRLCYNTIPLIGVSDGKTQTKKILPRVLSISCS